MPQRFVHEERWNTLTHALGIAASALGGTALIVIATLSGNPWQIVATSLFTASLLLLYTASTLYHAVSSPAAKLRLRVLDHCAIYVLIAGTYTPFLLGGLRGPWGWSLFGVIWGLALAGVVFKLFFTGRLHRLSTLIYIAMGWLVLIAAGPLLRTLGGVTIAWLAAGGIVYTAGTAFYHRERMPYAHAIWHLFVLAGSTAHGIAVFTHLRM
ncbi:MAG TPA: hemolysin III family protein [Longimicrobiales bacterium]|nr:hemolysin III family protein [Longimicrobiales bacterium]